jgi:hypothetical protein
MALQKPCPGIRHPGGFGFCVEASAYCPKPGGENGGLQAFLQSQG